MTHHYYDNPVPLWVINITGFCVCITASLFLIQLYAQERATVQVQMEQIAERTLPLPDELENNPFKDIGLEAKAAIVFDVSNQRIISTFNSKPQLPLASITKLMTAIVALETLPSFTAIPIARRDVEYDPKLKVGESWPLENLLKYTLITSSNTGADSAALAVAAFLDGEGATPATTEEISHDAFIRAMNIKAQGLGLAQTYFLNGSGLDTQAKISGAYGSAKDVATFVAYALEKHPGLFGATREESTTFRAPDGRAIEAINTNSSVSTIPGILGSKTGLTDLAGGNLVIAFDASFGEPYIVVVLGSTEEGRFSDTEKLVNATITYLGGGLYDPSNRAKTSTPNVVAP